jgi:hypothetical protein
MTMTTETELRLVKSEFTANTFNTGAQLAPDVLGLSNGGFALAYNNGSLVDGAIRVDFYDANYQAIGTAKIPYAGTHTDAVGEPSLTELDNGNVLVVWEDNNTDIGSGNDDAGVKGAIFDQSGNTIKGEFAVHYGSYWYNGVDVTALNNGNFVVSSRYVGGMWNDMSFSIYNSNGDHLTYVKVDDADAGTPTNAQVSALGTGGFVFTWLKADGSGSPTAYADIYTNSGGFKKTIELSESCSDIAVTGMADGNLAVAMRFHTDPGADLKIMVLKQDGTIVNWGTAGWAQNHKSADPDIIQLDTGHILVTWTDEYSPTDHDIYGTLFDANGNHVWVNGEIEFHIDASGHDDIKSTVSSMLDDGFVVASQDSIGSSISASVGEFVGTGQGDNGNDTYVGSNLKDEVEGGGGKDTLSGGGGDDFIDGGSENDLLNGGGGHDAIYGGAGNDTIQGAITDDASTWMEGDELYGDAGNDIIVGYWGNDTIYGGSGKDSINAEKGDDRIAINKGDVVAGEQINGGDGNDKLVLNAINVPSTIDISGLALFNVETIELGGVFDEDTTFVMDAGLFWAGNEDIKISGVNGQHDTVIINMGATTNANLFQVQMDLATFPGFDKVFINGDADAETIRGTSFGETINGNGGKDTIHAGNGDTVFGGDDTDVMYASSGPNKFDGGDGKDTVSYQHWNGVAVALDGSFLNQGAAAADSFTSVEILKGSNSATKADKFRGDDGAQTFFGNIGNDTLDGAGGNDKLVGGEGQDVLIGGAGSDQFLYYYKNEAGDQVTDFSSNAAGNNDLLLFKGAEFGGLAAGDLEANQFQSSAANVAGKGSIRFFYETDTATLRFDADGNGAGASIVVATLQAGATMTIDDILIF